MRINNLGVILVIVFFTISCDAFKKAGDERNEAQQREQVLLKLVATNAPLATVEASLGFKIKIIKRGTELFSKVETTVMSDAQKYKGARYRDLRDKLSKSAAYGHMSTISWQTWIFLDDQDRLIAFIIDSQ